MYKVDLALNNLQYLVCLKTKPNQTFYYAKGAFIERNSNQTLSRNAKSLNISVF